MKKYIRWLKLPEVPFVSPAFINSDLIDVIKSNSLELKIVRLKRFGRANNYYEIDPSIFHAQGGVFKTFDTLEEAQSPFKIGDAVYYTNYTIQNCYWKDEKDNENRQVVISEVGEYRFSRGKDYEPVFTSERGLVSNSAYYAQKHFLDWRYKDYVYKAPKVPVKEPEIPRVVLGDGTIVKEGIFLVGLPSTEINKRIYLVENYQDGRWKLNNKLKHIGGGYPVSIVAPKAFGLATKQQVIDAYFSCGWRYEDMSPEAYKWIFKDSFMISKGTSVREVPCNIGDIFKINSIINGTLQFDRINNNPTNLISFSCDYPENYTHQFYIVAELPKEKPEMKEPEKEPIEDNNSTTLIKTDVQVTDFNEVILSSNKRLKEANPSNKYYVIENELPIYKPIPKQNEQKSSREAFPKHCRKSFSKT